VRKPAPLQSSTTHGGVPASRQMEYLLLINHIPCKTCLHPQSCTHEDEINRHAVGLASHPWPLVWLSGSCPGWRREKNLNGGGKTYIINVKSENFEGAYETTRGRNAHLGQQRVQLKLNAVPTSTATGGKPGGTCKTTGHPMNKGTLHSPRRTTD
jgi:hypothetical protein